MSYEELLQAFKDVAKPTTVEGDPMGLDASTEEIQRLLDADPQTLTMKDFQSYLGYCTTGGIDDLRYLLPTVLRIWHEELNHPQEPLRAPLEYIHEELVRTDIIDSHLSPAQRTAVVTFMRNSLIERIGQETSLRIEGCLSDTYIWFRCLTSYGTITEDIPQVWKCFWAMPTAGHARAVIQYASCLICVDKHNPVFLPWSRDLGGGAPCLWEYESSGFNECWKNANISFLQSTLTPTYLHDHLVAAKSLLTNRSEIDCVNSLLHELQQVPQRASHRCVELPKFLSQRDLPVTAKWSL